MIIKQLTIKNFGKFHQKQIAFSPGLNLIYGENESGKSTLHTFIQGIFFGIRKMRGRAAKNDVYSRYEPWENPGYYEGMVYFICGEKEFRLSRVFQKDNQSTELVCESDGEKLSCEDGDLNVLLGNISEAAYYNTVSIGQLKSQTTQELVTELQNYVTNYQSSMDDELDIKKALAILGDKKKNLERKKREGEMEAEQGQKELRTRISYLENEREALLGQQEEIKRDLQQLTIHHRQKTGKGEQRVSFPMLPCLGVLCVLFVTGLFLIPGTWGKIALAAGTLLLSVFCMMRGADRNDSRDEGQKGEAEVLHKLTWTLEHLQEEQRERDAMLSNAREEYRELLEERNIDVSIQEEIEAVCLAMRTIEELSQGLQSTVGLELKRITERILGELTDGKYTQVSISSSFEMGLNTKERYVPLERLSRGTIEQVYFALRMAVGEILCKEEMLPVLLDDAFAMYDEKRLANTLKWLAQRKEQVLLFTCHKREQELLDNMGISYQLVRL